MTIRSVARKTRSKQLLLAANKRRLAYLKRKNSHLEKQNCAMIKKVSSRLRKLCADDPQRPSPLPSWALKEKLQTAIDAGALETLEGLYMVNSLFRAVAMATYYERRSAAACSRGAK